jgi:hypothetical protein
MANSYEYTPLYYATPCQVRFFHPTYLDFKGGIALHNMIICGVDGEIFITDYIVSNAAAHNIHWDDAVVELEWLDINYAIKGE